MSDDLVRAAIVTLDAAIASLQAQRATLAHIIGPKSEPEPPDPDAPCRHSSCFTVNVMGKDPVRVCKECGENLP